MSKLTRIVFIHLLMASPTLDTPEGKALAKLQSATRLTRAQIIKLFDRFRNEGIPLFVGQDRQSDGAFVRDKTLLPRHRMRQLLLVDKAKAELLAQQVAEILARIRISTGLDALDEDKPKTHRQSKSVYAWMDNAVANKDLFDVLVCMAVPTTATAAMRRFVQETHTAKELALFDKFFADGPRCLSAVLYAKDTDSGMERHVDCTAFGTVLLSLTEDDSKETALTVHQHDKTVSCCVLKPGEAVIFTRQRHEVPLAKRKTNRVTVNAFF